MPDTFIHWPTALVQAKAFVTGEDHRDSMLAQAQDRLERVIRHERWDMSTQDYADQAAEFLRRAGLHDLADEVSDEFGFDADSVLAEVTRIRGEG